MPLPTLPPVLLFASLLSGSMVLALRLPLAECRPTSWEILASSLRLGSRIGSGSKGGSFLLPFNFPTPSFSSDSSLITWLGEFEVSAPLLAPYSMAREVFLLPNKEGGREGNVLLDSLPISLISSNPLSGVISCLSRFLKVSFFSIL